MPQIDLSILNQRQTPAFYADVFANRPAAGFIGRIFVSTNTYEFYRDNGTGWDLIGGPGSGTVTGGGSLYRVGIWTSTSNIGESANLVFDYSQGHLGINTSTPGTALDVHHNQNTVLQLNQTDAVNDTRIAFQNSGTALWRIGNFYNGTANDFGIFDVVGGQQTMLIKKTTGQILIGTSTVGSGKLVVSSNNSDNGIQIVGASAPSLRLDNAATGPTKRVGLGIATALNNFIQGAVDRDFCIFNGSTTAASPILFGVYDAGLTNVQEAARISAARNFIVGSTTDIGPKLQVTGNTFLSGSVGLGINASANNSLLVSKPMTGSVDSLHINVNGIIQSDVTNSAIYFRSSASTVGGFSLTNLTHYVANQGAFTASVTNQYGYFVANTLIGATFNYGFFGAIPSGSNRWNLYMAGSAANYLNGNLLIGTTTDAGFKLEVNGTTRLINSVIIGSSATGQGNLYVVGGDVVIGNSSGLLRANNFNNGPGGGIVISASNTAANQYTAFGVTASGTGAFTEVARFSNNGNLLIGTATNGASKLRIVGLPTSAAGLSSGDVYSNAGILTIVP